jgi:hypothetical protein
MSLRTVEWCLAWGKPMREARDPCTRRATRRASIDSRTEASGRAMQPHDARLGFRHHAAHPLGGGHHRIPDTVSITVARRLAMRRRHHLRYTGLAVVAFADEHTDGGTWRGASQPPRTAPPRHVSYIERECLAQIPPNVRARQSDRQRPTRWLQVITGSAPSGARLQAIEIDLTSAGGPTGAQECLG